MTELPITTVDNDEWNIPQACVDKLLESYFDSTRDKSKETVMKCYGCGNEINESKSYAGTSEHPWCSKECLDKYNGQIKYVPLSTATDAVFKPVELKAKDIKFFPVAAMPSDPGAEEPRGIMVPVRPVDASAAWEAIKAKIDSKYPGVTFADAEPIDPEKAGVKTGEGGWGPNEFGHDWPWQGDGLKNPDVTVTGTLAATGKKDNDRDDRSRQKVLKISRQLMEQVLLQVAELPEDIEITAISDEVFTGDILFRLRSKSYPVVPEGGTYLPVLSEWFKHSDATALVKELTNLIMDQRCKLLDMDKNPEYAKHVRESGEGPFCSSDCVREDLMRRGLVPRPGESGYVNEPVLLAATLRGQGPFYSADSFKRIK